MQDLRTPRIRLEHIFLSSLLGFFRRRLEEQDLGDQGEQFVYELDVGASQQLGEGASQQLGEGASQQRGEGASQQLGEGASQQLGEGDSFGVDFAERDKGEDQSKPFLFQAVKLSDPDN